MLIEPHVTDSPTVHAAVIRLTIPRADIVKVMGPGIGEIMSHLGRLGIVPVGAWYTHHYRMDPTEFDFDIGVPVAAPVIPGGRVTTGGLRATRVARCIYQGPYEGLGAAWGEFDAWIKSQGLVPAKDLWERYILGPESGPDASQYQTELNRPLNS